MFPPAPGSGVDDDVISLGYPVVPVEVTLRLLSSTQDALHPVLRGIIDVINVHA